MHTLIIRMTLYIYIYTHTDIYIYICKPANTHICVYNKFNLYYQRNATNTYFIIFPSNVCVVFAIDYCLFFYRLPLL